MKKSLSFACYKVKQKNKIEAITYGDKVNAN